MFVDDVTWYCSCFRVVGIFTQLAFAFSPELQVARVQARAGDSRALPLSCEATSVLRRLMNIASVPGFFIVSLFLRLHRLAASTTPPFPGTRFPPPAEISPLTRLSFRAAPALQIAKKSCARFWFQEGRQRHSLIKLPVCTLTHLRLPIVASFLATCVAFIPGIISHSWQTSLAVDMNLLK